VVLVYSGECVKIVVMVLWYWYILVTVVTYFLGRCGTGMYWGLR
jgi:hypothetical protein